MNPEIIRIITDIENTIKELQLAQSNARENNLNESKKHLQIATDKLVRDIYPFLVSLTTQGVQE